MLSIKRLDTLSEIVQYQEQITNMFNQYEVQHIHTSYEWMKIWLDVFGFREKLCCFIVIKDSNVIGFAPLHIIGKRILGVNMKILKLLGNEFSSRSDIVVIEDQDKVYSLILKEIQKLKWDVFDIGRISGTSCFLSFLLKQYRNHLPSLRMKKVYEDPCINVEGSFESYLQGKTSNFRRNIKRIKRLMKEKALEIEYYPEPVINAEEAMGLINTIERNSWKDTEHTGIHSSAGACSFYKNLIEQYQKEDRLSLSFLYYGSTPIAYFLACVHEGIKYCLKASYDSNYKKLNPGLLLLMNEIEVSFKDIQLDEMDLDCAVSHSDYKYRWMTHINKYYSYRLFRNRPFSLMLNILHIWKFKKIREANKSWVQ